LFYPKYLAFNIVSFNNIALSNNWPLQMNNLDNSIKLTQGGLASASTKPFLGYLCETRPITTLAGTDMCQFPFSYQGKTYTSCSFENNSLLNNNGAPWCATEVGQRIN
jgi:hypothetical protein